MARLFHFVNAIIGYYLLSTTTISNVAGIDLDRSQLFTTSNRKRAPVTQTVNSDNASLNQDPQISEYCPEPFGYFADAEQCDKYYECRNGEITEKLCPDGLVFNDYNSEDEKCDLPFNIDCSARPKLQTPQPTANCPRKHGYFAHEDQSTCDKFYYCVDGQYNMITCPNGLVYNENAGICSWPDEAKKKGCSSKDVFQFECPIVDRNVGATHPRYADAEDCQYFYVCINGETPRRSGCRLGQVFDDDTKRCDWARNVAECADWYKGRLTDEELADLERPSTPKPKPGKVSSRRRPARPAKDVSADIAEATV